MTEYKILGDRKKKGLYQKAKQRSAEANKEVEDEEKRRRLINARRENGEDITEHEIDDETEEEGSSKLYIPEKPIILDKDLGVLDEVLKVGHVDHPSFISGIDFSPCGNYIATSCGDNKVRIFKTSVLEQIIEKEHPHQLNDVSFSRDGKHLATACDDKYFRIFDIKNDKLVNERKKLEGKSVRAVSFYKHCKKGELGHILHVGTDITPPKGQAVIYDFEEGAQNFGVLTRVPVGGDVYGFDLNRKHNVLAIAAGSSLKLHDAGPGHDLRTVKSHVGHIKGLAFSPDENYVATASSDGKIRLYAVDDLLKENNVDTTGFGGSGFGGSDPMYGVAFHPGGQYIAYGGQDKELTLMITGWKKK
ncbi:WD40 repeat domain-containing protein [Nanoarchaeota archaeon]